MPVSVPQGSFPLLFLNVTGSAQLLGPIQQGMIPAPHPMVVGTTERDYYQGKVSTGTPEQRLWVDRNRPKDGPSDTDEDELEQSREAHGTHAGDHYAADSNFGGTGR